MKKKHNQFFLSIILVSSMVVPIFAQISPNMPITAPKEGMEKDVVEEFPEYHSHINWTKGIIVTEFGIPISYQDKNIGRNIINLTESLKEKLIQFSVGALENLRVSSVFLLNNFLQKDQNLRYRVLSLLYDRSVESTVIKQARISGQYVMPLFGTNSITQLMYTTVQQKTITNHLQKETVATQFYDTLIIDTIMFPMFQAALDPRILDHSGNLLYSIETIDPTVLNTKGPFQYVTSITEALKHPSVGNKIAYVLPKSTDGTYSSDLVLFKEDVDRIFGQQRTINQLNQGKVIVIVPPKTTK